MTPVFGEEVLELVEQLLGDVRRSPELAKVRNYSPLRFDVTFAICDMALRHFQGGLAVHANDCTLNWLTWRFWSGPGLCLPYRGALWR